MRLAVLRAGLVYFSIAFAAGFLLGTMRVFFVAPKVGVLPATLIEIPLMLGVSWWACGWTLRRIAVPCRVAARATMGGIAFVVLITAEFALAVVGFGRPLTVVLAEYRETAAGAGLMAQIAFAAFPLFRR